MGPEEITTGLGLLGDKPTFADGEISALWPVTGDDERRALLEVLESGRWCRLKDEDWRTGEAGLFEEEFRDYLGAETFLAVSNGTLAIELGLLALGIGEGDEVIVQAATYFGTVTPILRVGATPVFVDVDPRTYTIDPDGVEAAITPRTRAVFAVHLAGQPADLDRLSAICQEHSLALLEDCAQAVGTDWRGRRVGTFGDIATFSFQQD
jgi:dTDP-4-amino-4,6-dideoxygalactose transaminase